MRIPWVIMRRDALAAARADLAACAARCEAMRKIALRAERSLRKLGADASDIMCEIESADRQ